MWVMGRSAFLQSVTHVMCGIDLSIATGSKKTYCAIEGQRKTLKVVTLVCLF